MTPSTPSTTHTTNTDRALITIGFVRAVLAAVAMQVRVNPEFCARINMSMSDEALQQQVQPILDAILSHCSVRIFTPQVVNRTVSTTSVGMRVRSIATLVTRYAAPDGKAAAGDLLSRRDSPQYQLVSVAVLNLIKQIHAGTIPPTQRTEFVSAKTGLPINLEAPFVRGQGDEAHMILRNQAAISDFIASLGEPVRPPAVARADANALPRQPSGESTPEHHDTEPAAEHDELADHTVDATGNAHASTNISTIKTPSSLTLVAPSPAPAGMTPAPAASGSSVVPAPIIPTPIIPASVVPSLSPAVATPTPRTGAYAGRGRRGGARVSGGQPRTTRSKTRTSADYAAATADASPAPVAAPPQYDHTPVRTRQKRTSPSPATAPAATKMRRVESQTTLIQEETESSADQSRLARVLIVAPYRVAAARATAHMDRNKQDEALVYAECAVAQQMSVEEFVAALPALIRSPTESLVNGK
ncbi:hypothetical protein AMAG_12940 [Allomyces macrogynus ATCC 38327]|uniref:Uncharacterized protein n=1 Tax=Allomyces macrogynus (strain ATCC 38327) TaxID=578462 RepID=A0A0L0T0U4_ALLM3|nr:hypothetical protein AMAG_12940 [Allomyces macrogynus ATCC 38327]|eukprot:KNE68270.1 hypothetical protein AMAG_12940 [Allomyces macrogynus ATCC 38327]